MEVFVNRQVEFNVAELIRADADVATELNSNKALKANGEVSLSDMSSP